MTVFKMGRIVATPGALSALHLAGECLGCILLRHESLNTTSRYCKQTEEQLAEASERLTY
jgi:hypothetical protein